MATVDQILACAYNEIGYVEKPVNDTKYGAYFKTNPAQWCGLFVMWVFAKENHRFPNTAYTPNGVRAFKNRNQWHTRGPVQPGDIVYFDWPNDNIDRVSHVGIAVHQFDNGDVLTIEGNTAGNSTGDQRNGGMVALKRRARTLIVGWGRPIYKPAELVFQPIIIQKWRDSQKPKPAKKTSTGPKK